MHVGNPFPIPGIPINWLPLISHTLSSVLITFQRPLHCKMTFVFGVPSSSATTKVVTSVKITGSIQTALPIGREALKRLGGKEKEVASAKDGESDFPEHLIVIPEGVTPQNLKNFTLYDMLGFAGELGAAADADVIKRAYHKAVLKYHPDKAQYKTADGKEDRTVFLKIQEAFTVLSSETKRRAYDSQLPFDESIPTEDRIQKGLAKGPQKFFKIFAPVFQRNARFAQQKPSGRFFFPKAQVKAARVAAARGKRLTGR